MCTQDNSRWHFKMTREQTVFHPTAMLIFMCLVAACMDRNPHQPHHEGGGYQGLQ